MINGDAINYRMSETDHAVGFICWALQAPRLS